MDSSRSSSGAGFMDSCRTCGSISTGIGGLFYLLVALMLPVRGLIVRLRGGRVSWRVEAEAYSAPFAPVGVVTVPNWRYISVSMGLLVWIAPK
jgi:hypothetical protein